MFNYNILKNSRFKRFFKSKNDKINKLYLKLYFFLITEKSKLMKIILNENKEYESLIKFY